MYNSRRFLRFILNIYPPLLFNRIVLIEISRDFSEMNVIIKKSLFNMNFYKSIFGGTIFSACDPYFPIMYYNIFKKRNKKLVIWLKSAKINYIKPANTNLRLQFKINKNNIHKIEEDISSKGKSEIWHKIQAINKDGVPCAEADMLIYLKENDKDGKVQF